jgi:5-methylcytosine-specific restriction protein A
MSRKAFIESHNATCKNWNWSWSFVNHESKMIIFGAWDTITNGNYALIFSEEWSRNRERKPPAFNESRSHLRLIEEDGYTLRTFKIIRDQKIEEDGTIKTKIKTFIPKLEQKQLSRIGINWYAISEGSIVIEEEITKDDIYHEGSKKTITVNSFERSSKAKAACLEYHGRVCQICEFDFTSKYGAIADGIIHVHHIVPLGEIGNSYEVNPIRDLIPVCPNCHAVIHRTKPALTIEQMKELIKKYGI